MCSVPTAKRYVQMKPQIVFFYVVPQMNYINLSQLVTLSVAILAELVINLEFGTLT